jgi:hypothetical protein
MYIVREECVFLIYRLAYRASLGKQGWACRRVAGEAQMWCECKYSEDAYACVFIDRKKSGMLPGRAAYYRASPRR